MKKGKLVVLTGAGISAESGLKTFRDSGGLWEGYNVYDVATPEAWEKNPVLVQDFYNQRRKAVLEAFPNPAHFGLAKLESDFDTTIITQNVDDLHERAGSTKIIHLHGEIIKSRSSFEPNLIYPIDGWELKMGDTCEMGSQLRPHIVWFGEAVPEFEKAIKVVKKADILVIIGTSMQVYPAAGLINYAGEVPVYFLDPKKSDIPSGHKIVFIEEKASTGIEKLITLLQEIKHNV